MKELWWSVCCWPILAIGRRQCLICYGASLGNLSQVFPRIFFLLLRNFLQFHAGIAGMTCDVSGSLGKFRAGIAPIVMLPVLALLRRQCSICCVASLGHFSHSLLELWCCLVLAISRRHCSGSDVGCLVNFTQVLLELCWTWTHLNISWLQVFSFLFKSNRNL